MRVACCLALSVLAIACRPSPTPCSTPGTCPAGTECLANRCVTQGGDPVSAGARRIVLRPSILAVVSSRQRSVSLPGAVVFGSRVGGATAIYLAFDPVWRRKPPVESAFVLLSPLEGTGASVPDVPVHVWRAARPWKVDHLTWLEQPAHEGPTAQGIARSSPPSTLRIDVTEIVRYLADHPYEDHGLVIEASAGDGPGTAFATGATGGVGPRLELYYAAQAQGTYTR
jgi:hypothetical protein